MTLTSAELASMRTEINKLLPDTCTIYTSTVTPDSMGGFTTAWTAAGTVACRLDADLAGEGLLGGAVQPYERYTLTVPQGTTITGGNQVKIGSTTYNVVGINLGPSWALDMRVKVQVVL
jgi:hypothetical protein